ncbi:MAG: hypothetical protein BWY65_02400 [Firmicutes bacterium ADurb.Bin373]|nr:MAG: hypothetical protein BWY65_02400 [Firmicutes bacterium ADurb.Bin373]
MAIPVPKIMEDPIPCTILNAISAWIDQAIPHRKEKRENIIMPKVKTLFLPIISANRPNGSRKAAVERR